MHKLIIEYQETPNPNTLKFYPIDHSVCMGKILEFRKDGQFVNSALARDLLAIPAVDIVLFGNDFISVSKKAELNLKWSDLRAEIIFTIICHENSIIEGKLFDNEEQKIEDEEDDCVEFDEGCEETVLLIKELLDNDIRPRVAMDGGDIKLRAYKKGIAYLKLRGACSGCPSSGITLHNYVRDFLLFNVEELVDVEQW